MGDPATAADLRAGSLGPFAEGRVEDSTIDDDRLGVAVV